MTKIKKRALWAIVFLLSFFLSQSSVQAKFIKTFACRVGGNDLNSSDGVKLAKYDIIFANKFHYDDISRDSWGAIKAINPDAEIHLYTLTSYSNPGNDSLPVIALNGLGRYNVSRGHSMGSLNGDHPNFFLLNASGARVKSTWKPTIEKYWLDFGNDGFRRYAAEATITDHVGHPWTADGVFFDVDVAIKHLADSTPVLYDTDAKWAAAMNGMINYMTAVMHNNGQKASYNRLFTRTAAGYDAWMALDAVANPPDAVMEEGGFVISWGPADAQFYTEIEWKREVDVIKNIRNSKTCNQSHVDISPGESGTDNWGKTFTFWDALWFALGSQSIAMNTVDDNSYFGFSDGTNYNIIYWFDEYDAMDGGNLDLGAAVGTYKVSNISGVNIYWRAFERGYVYVNPTNSNVSSISLPELCKELNHTNFKNDLKNMPDKNTISLNAHRAVFLRKSSAGDVPGNVSPSPPKDLKIR